MTSVLVHSTETNGATVNGFDANSVAELLKGLNRTKSREIIAKHLLSLKPGTDTNPTKVAKATGLHRKQVAKTLHDFASAAKLLRHKDDKSGDWMFTTTAGPVTTRPIKPAPRPGQAQLLRDFLADREPGFEFTAHDLSALAPNLDSNAWSAALAYARAKGRVIVVRMEKVPAGGVRNIYAKPYPETEDHIAPVIPTQRAEPETDPGDTFPSEETDTPEPSEDQPEGPTFDEVNVFPREFVPASGDWFEMMRFPAGIQVETETNRRGETVLWVRRTA